MKKVKELKIKFLQSIADSIIEGMRVVKTKKEVQFLFEFGFKFNLWCVFYDIYLN